jgi:hypothetical protein
MIVFFALASDADNEYMMIDATIHARFAATKYGWRPKAARNSQDLWIGVSQ